MGRIRVYKSVYMYRGARMTWCSSTIPQSLLAKLWPASMRASLMPKSALIETIIDMTDLSKMTFQQTQCIVFENMMALICPSSECDIMGPCERKNDI